MYEKDYFRPRGMSDPQLLEWIFSQSEKDGDCLIWNRSESFSFNSFCYSIGKVVWYLTHGSWSERRLFRTCGQTKCVNPDHLKISVFSNPDRVEKPIEKISDEELLDYIMKKTTIVDDCYIWDGHLSMRRNLYPLSHWSFPEEFKRRSISMNKLVWRLTTGEWPDVLRFDHTCRKSNCINPKHFSFSGKEENG